MSTLSNQKNEHNQLDSLVLLRGIAVLIVCLCHFGGALSEGHILSGLFQLFHDYGKYGVHIFFVISGFVIPLSLLKGKYAFNDYPRFLYKRVLRLHPPYIAALFLTLIIMYLSYKVRHIPFPENIGSILKSLVYCHIPADNPVFWTLIVEAQYYVFIGLFFFLLMNNTKIAYFVIMPALLILGTSIVKQYFSLQSFFVFFFIGNVGYMIYTKNGHKTINYIALVSLLIFAAWFYETAAFIASLLTITVILFYRKRVSDTLKFMGVISYSVYLIHFPIGIKFINLIKTKISAEYSWLLFVVTLIIVVGTAWVFYKVFEEFSERLSKGVKYKAYAQKITTNDGN